MLTTHQTSRAVIQDVAFPALSDYIIATTGLRFYADRPAALAGHIDTRLAERGLTDCAAYLALLQNEQGGEDELDQLITHLTIGETYFFRHAELFDALRQVALPEIMARNQTTKRLRIWSAGCSTGPEVYSLSILFRRDFGELLRGWQVSLVGTDINREFLARANEGCYEEWAFRGTTPELRRQCFEKCGDTWRVSSRFREGVTFQYHNLARHSFPSLVQGLIAFDLILCRNVLIYFAPHIVERIGRQLAECLAPGGWLAVGHAEHGLHLRQAFDVVNCPGATLYRKPAAVTKPISRQNAICDEEQVSRAASDSNSVGKEPIRAPRAATRAEWSPVSRHNENRIKLRSSLEHIRELADRGNMTAALQSCQALIARKPLDPAGHFYQALLLDQLAENDAARSALNKAVYLNREFELAHYYLGVTQQKMGETPGAIRSFRNVLRLLESRDRSTHLPDADGMTVGDLQDLTRMHLQTLEAA
jgi:chemotaxis protein methyltransferase CheR